MLFANLILIEVAYQRRDVENGERVFVLEVVVSLGYAQVDL